MSDLERARRVHTLLIDALALSEAERGRFLREQCGEDEDLIGQVNQLLQGAGDAEQYFNRLGEDVGDVLEGTAERAATAAQNDPPTAASPEPEPPELEIGQKLGHFRVSGELGRGGMGTVYRATDLRLGREVALKVLPLAVSDGSEMAERFAQEARLLAALSHTNIASIFGIEEDGGRRLLVLELVDGPGLEERIARGRLSVRESLETASQIARALEVAHRAGIVHRDLKPSNVKLVGSTGVAKVLDFGIATVLPDARVASASAHKDIVSTGVGRVLGTVAYMSPEQARGDQVDERTDIWAWGCVLYEMLCGQRPFQGRTVTDTLAAIIEREPDWTRLPATLPAEVSRMLRRCLNKDPRRRLRNAGDLWLILEELLHPGTEDEQPLLEAPPASNWHRVLPWALAIAAAGAGILLGRGLDDPAEEPTRRLELLVGGEQLRTAAGGRTVAISADGTTLAHTADGKLHLRPLDAFEDHELEGGFGAESPAFSPDGAWLSFFQRGQLRKISVLGGDPFPLCAAALPRGSDWGDDNRIVFSDGASLFTVSGSGGDCRPLRSPGPADDQVKFLWPTWLPGGTQVLFQMTGPRSNGIAVLDVASGEITQVQSSGSDPRFVQTGHILYTRLGTVFAVSYDPATGEIGTNPRPVLDGISAESTGASHMAVSTDGVLAYAPSPDPSRDLVWVARDGSERLAAPASGDYTTPRVSPDATRIAVVIRRAGERQIWVYDLRNETVRQLTQGGTNIWPAWAPDGERISFSNGIEGPATIWWQSADGSAATKISTQGRHQYASSWAAHENVITWFQPGPDGTRDIWAHRLDSEAGSFPVVATSAHEQGPALSPDARWIAYAANTTGRNEIYVEACPGCRGGDDSDAPQGRWQVSTAGGGEVVWSPRGDELFYREGSKVMSVSIDFSSGVPRAQSPMELFDGPYVIGQSGNSEYAVAPDGDRFLMVKNPEESGAQRIRVVLNWFAELP